MEPTKTYTYIFTFRFSSGGEGFWGESCGGLTTLSPHPLSYATGTRPPKSYFRQKKFPDLTQTFPEEFFENSKFQDVFFCPVFLFMPSGHETNSSTDFLV